MGLDDTANDEPEGRAGLPDEIIVGMNDLEIWAGNRQTGESVTHAHFHELSEFVFYFCQPATTLLGGDGDFYTIVCNALPATRNPSWRNDLVSFAVTIWVQNEANQERYFKPGGDKMVRKLFLDALPPADMVNPELHALIELMKKFDKPHQKMGFWCMGVRRLRMYGVDLALSPDTPDFGRVIYNKAVRLTLEESCLPPSLRSSSSYPKRSIDASGDMEEQILSNWEADKRNGYTKDCTSVKDAASFFTEVNTFFHVLALDKITFRAQTKRLQKIYCEEFPELMHDVVDSQLPEDVEQMLKEMPLPDQQRFVETLKLKAHTHKVLGGTLDTTFLRQLNHEIRQGITQPMYDGWARVFKLRDKDRNMPLLKMAVNWAYLCVFICDSFDEHADEKCKEQVALANDAAKRLQDVCDTNILMDGGRLHPTFL